MEIIYNLIIYLTPIITIPLYFTYMDKYRENYLWHFLLLLFTVLYFVLVFIKIYAFANYVLVIGQMFFLGWGASFRFSYKLFDEKDKRSKMPYVVNILFGMFYWIISSSILLNYKFDFIEYIFNSKWIMKLLNQTYSEDYIFIHLTPFVNYLSIFLLLYCLYLAIYSFIMFVKLKEISLKYQLTPLLPTLLLSYFLFIMLQ